MTINFRHLRFATILALIFVSGLNSVQAQDRSKPATPTTEPAKPASSAAATPPKTGIRPYKEVITDKAKTDKGLFKVHRLDGKYFYEIPDSLFNREMLVVTRYSRTPTIDGTYGGEELNEQIWKWQRRDKQVMIRIPSYNNIADRKTEIYQAVRNSNLDAVLSSFEIKAVNKDSNSVVIDITDLYAMDVQSFGLPQSIRTQYKITTLA